MKLFLVQHTDHGASVPERKINSQLEGLSRLFCDKEVTALYSPDTAETTKAAYVLSQCVQRNGVFQIQSDLRPRHDFGEDWSRSWNRSRNGESQQKEVWGDFFVRVKRAVEDIVEETNGPVIILTHACVIQAILCLIRNERAEPVSRPSSLGASISELQWHRKTKTWEVCCEGSLAHVHL